MKNRFGLSGLSSPVNSLTRACSPAKIAGLALIASAALGSQSKAAVTFIGNDGGSRSASAVFSVSGDVLNIVLSNTFSGDTNLPDQVLSSIYFKLDGSSSLTKTGGSVMLDGSQVLVNGSDVTGGVLGGGGNVSGEYAFRSGLSGGFFGSDPFYGVSANGMGGLFGDTNLFSGPNLEGPSSPNGTNYGLVSSGYVVTSDNGGLTGRPLIKDSVSISLYGATGLDLSNLSEVIFQYGTEASEPYFNGTPRDPFINPIPEPGSTAALMGLLSCGLFLRSRRKALA